MPLSVLFEALAESRNPAADDALVAALRESEPAATGPIVRTLLARGRPSGVAGLIGQYHRIGDEDRRLILESVDQLYGALRDCCSMEDPQARLNVVTVVSDARGYRLSYLLSSLLRDRSPRVRKAAACTMQQLVDRFLADLAKWNEAWAAEPCTPSPDMIAQRRSELRRHLGDRDQLVEAVGAGVESFDKHLHPPVIEAAMWLVDHMSDRFWSTLRSAGGHARRAALDIVQTAMSPRLVPFAIEGLAYDEFRPTLVRMLSSRMAEDVLLEWARQSWRLDAEPLRKPMRLVKQWPQLVEVLGRAELWPEADQRHIVRLLTHTHLPPDTKVSLLRRLLTLGDATRRTAVWALCGIPSAASTMLLRTVAASGDDVPARVARRELRRRTTIEAREQRSAEASGESQPVSGLDQYWAEYEALEPDEQARRGAAILGHAGNAEAFQRNRLNSHSVPVRVKALRILTVTGCASAFEQSVYALAHDPDAVVRSAAMAALGHVRTATSELLLRSALRDPEPRVQANALEALDQLSATSKEPLVHEKLYDGNNRTRANAVKALVKLRVREAAESLYGMLRDPDPEQRRSALWVVAQLRLSPLISRIVELARSDPDMQVRHRAQGVLVGLDSRKSRRGAGRNVGEVML